MWFQIGLVLDAASWSSSRQEPGFLVSKHYAFFYNYCFQVLGSSEGRCVNKGYMQVTDGRKTAPSKDGCIVRRPRLV